LIGSKTSLEGPVPGQNQFPHANDEGSIASGISGVDECGQLESIHFQYSPRPRFHDDRCLEDQQVGRIRYVQRKDADKTIFQIELASSQIDGFEQVLTADHDGCVSRVADGNPLSDSPPETLEILILGIKIGIHC